MFLLKYNFTTLATSYKSEKHLDVQKILFTIPAGKPFLFMW